ncbi:Lrp/AsnC family transcriptional regulator [Streptomyces sp. SID3343]|uniref:Lrp/AsnC family transcriptional regulator n=1 Tax=Streptomyces sp. SID3343 TaxID=2690260 RepID=UPI00136873AA|nr:Lrp/AsnC family transcriptional regulator [Streptomyces sp. SID3343]MYW05225.1 AsnC family transcriptional regulator [Streptomyces sp. SID3343]
MNTVSLDPLDRALVHALRIDGRVPFRTAAQVLGVSEHTVARRYRRLRAEGALRVVGVVNGVALGWTSWTVRLRCTPDAAGGVAAALASRPDTSFVYLLSGGTEICCNVVTRSTADRDALLLHKLPRTSRVTSVSAHLLLRATALPNDWAGAAELAAEQVDHLRLAVAAPRVETIALDDADRSMLRILARDGRAGYTELASAAGCSASTVKRRTDALRGAGVVSYEVDIAPAALGFAAEARLWMSVRPSGLLGVGQALAGHPEVSFAALTTGPSNLVAAVNCRDAEDLCRYLTERVGALDAIRTLESAPVIRTLKRAGAAPAAG